MATRPPNRTMQLYLVKWTGPDGPHISAARSMRYGTDAEKAFVEAEITRAMKPASPEHPEGNPDITIDSIEPVRDNNPAVVFDAAKQLKAANPERPLAHELGLDTPNRVLHEPEILRNVAATQTPG